MILLIHLESNMQFLDGNRIDKDKLASHIPPANESSYYIHKPTEEKYIGCCNAFFFAIGSRGKYLEKYLEPQKWQNYLRTYVDLDYDKMLFLQFLIAYT